MKYLNNRYLYGWMVLLSSILMQSCTKNELIPYEREPLNKILEYKVTNNPQHMMGAINHENNTIKIYIPYYTNLDYLVSSITLDEGATLLRMDSTVINLLEDELDPVVIGDTVQYIVRSAAGEFRTYTLTQEILPHHNPIAVFGYANAAQTSMFGFQMHTLEDGVYPVNANRVFYLFANLMSSSTLGSITLTNRETGVIHKDYVEISSVSPQAEDNYVMTLRMSPQAQYGTYDVKLEHQGRVAELSPIEVYYTLSTGTTFASSAAYAPGDTVVFTANNSTFAKPERLYVRINKSTRVGDVPEGFAENIYGQEIDMKVVSAGRTEVKAIFPDIPVGLYRNYQQNVINFLTVFASEDGFEENTAFHKEVKIGTPSTLGFTVLSPKE